MEITQIGVGPGFRLVIVQETFIFDFYSFLSALEILEKLQYAGSLHEAVRLLDIPT